MRHIQQADAWEGSLVSFGMNPKAYVTSVKTDEPGDGSLTAALLHVHDYLEKRYLQDRRLDHPDAALIKDLSQIKHFDEAAWAPVDAELRAWGEQRPAKPTYTDGDEHWIYTRWGKTRRVAVGR